MTPTPTPAAVADLPVTNNFKALLLLSALIWGLAVTATGLLVQSDDVLDKVDDAHLWMHREGVALPTRFAAGRAS